MICLFKNGTILTKSLNISNERLDLLIIFMYPLQQFRTPISYLRTIILKYNDMNKIKELIIKVLDEGETTSIKELKMLPFKVNKWLFISTSLIVPFGVCILASFVIDVNSREFTAVSLTLVLNWLIVLCWILQDMINTWIKK